MHENCYFYENCQDQGPMSEVGGAAKCC